MNGQNSIKLNQLYQILPENAIVPSKWLKAKGYNRQRVHNYVLSGWLKAVGKGAYSRPTTGITWQGLAASLQNVEGTSSHVGGETALTVQGFAHYLRLSGENGIYIFGDSAIPAWASNVSLGFSLKAIRKQLFDDTTKTTGLVSLPSNIKEWGLTVSSPERAILEQLSFVKDEFSFTFAAELMEGLTTLRPDIINTLLQSCTRVAVKRLFLFLAEYYNHPWMEKVNKDTINLGSGKRGIVKGGILNKKYLITVPEKFHV